MKNLIVGALLAVASISISVSVGCTASGDDDDGGGGGGGSGTTVDVSWKFTSAADQGTNACPDGFGTATVMSQKTDDTTHLGTGTPIADKYDCSAGKGTILLPDADTYLVWVVIEDSTGSNQYAQSDSAYVDTSATVAPIEFNILDDGGYFYLEWDIVDSTTMAHMTCADAGLATGDSVEVISTSMANSSDFKTDMFTCQDHYGTTDGLVAGSYTVSIDAEVNGAAVGTADTLTSKEITAPNGLTNLGLVLIPVDSH
ncbi:MAG TPA: hypothetical protein VH165_26400 [Kofleriaceae bacterium]|jgi:hypothetical protein|nr:hypothetical protein [Kofleriaceae bacterium]